MKPNDIISLLLIIGMLLTSLVGYKQGYADGVKSTKAHPTRPSKYNKFKK